MCETNPFFPVTIRTSGSTSCECASDGENKNKSKSDSNSAVYDTALEEWMHFFSILKLALPPREEPHGAVETFISLFPHHPHQSQLPRSQSNRKPLKKRASANVVRRISQMRFPPSPASAPTKGARMHFLPSLLPRNRSADEANSD